LVHSYQHSEERDSSKLGGTKRTVKYPEDGGSTKRRIDNNFTLIYEGWNFNSGNYLFTTDTK